MRFLNQKTNIDFMGKRNLALVISSILVILAIVILPIRGLNFGLDFTGGTLVEVAFPTAPEISAVRDILAAEGLDKAVVQTFGAATDIIIRVPPSETDESDVDIADRVLAALKQGIGSDVEKRRGEFVGPQVGEELTEQGILAVVYALIGIFLYVLFRFQWRFSVGAVVAVVHDILFSMGVLSLLQIEFDLTVVAALLAVVGYSLNDTIVLFDRIRENFPKLGKRTSIEVINISVNETLSRTLMTSLTTLMVLVALFYFGGEIIHGFALTLIIGVVVGTYSSIYVASSALLLLNVSKFDLLVVEKEGVNLDAHL
ncbi:MAG: preprotein translocase subunit SecF [Lysobacterales bacterium]|jgi:preprotein translocase subunit SecF